MYSWYQNAEICWTYLADVPAGVDPNKPGSAFEQTRWLTRGFTLQELLAPPEVILLSREWVEIGKKSTLEKKALRGARRAEGFAFSPIGDEHECGGLKCGSLMTLYGVRSPSASSLATGGPNDFCNPP